MFVLSSSVNFVHHGNCCNSSCVVHSGAGSRKMRDKYKRTASVRKNAKGFGLSTSNFCETSFNARKTSSYGSIGGAGFSFFFFPGRFRFNKNHSPTADKTTKSTITHGHKEAFNFAAGRRSRMSPRFCGSSPSGVGCRGICPAFGASLFIKAIVGEPTGRFAATDDV